MGLRIAHLNSQARFVLGSVGGLVIAGVLVGLFSTVFAESPFADAVISGLTLLGMGLAIGGYLAHHRGYHSPTFDFVFGFGIGLVIVAFFGAGSGTLTFSF